MKHQIFSKKVRFTLMQAQELQIKSLQLKKTPSKQKFKTNTAAVEQKPKQTPHSKNPKNSARIKQTTRQHSNSPKQAINHRRTPITGKFNQKPEPETQN